MKSQDFLDTIHSDSDLFSFGIIDYNKGMAMFIDDHDVSHNYINYKTEEGIRESIFLENITFSNLESISDQFNIGGFIYAKRNHNYQINEVVSDHGKTKYIFEMWDKLEGNHTKIASTDTIKINDQLTEGLIFSDQVGIEIPFFEDVDQSYQHKYEENVLVDGVKQNTLNKIRQIIR